MAGDGNYILFCSDVTSLHVLKDGKLFPISSLIILSWCSHYFYNVFSVYFLFVFFFVRIVFMMFRDKYQILTF